MNKINEFIINEIKRIVASSNADTKYKTPLIGFANANNPLFLNLKNIIGEYHFVPNDLLNNAKTVVSFFLPYSDEIVLNNLTDEITTKEWAYAKRDTEDIINTIIDKMKIKLSDMNIECSDNPGKFSYDQAKFMHRWSQRHIAYICGLGNFGINQLLITESGCAGRYGSFIIDEELDYNSISDEEYCLYKINQSCGVCVINCPSEALNYDGIDKSRCSKRIKENTDKYFDSIKQLGSCGKCIALPCALKRPRINTLDIF